MWDNGGGAWYQLNTECAFVTFPSQFRAIGKIDNPNVGRDVEIAPLTTIVNNHPEQIYWALECNGSAEYSQHPNDYLDNPPISIQNTDVLFWYVETWNCNQTAWPPNGGNSTAWSEICYQNFRG
jgi:hypothetical protein